MLLLTLDAKLLFFLFAFQQRRKGPGELEGSLARGTDGAECTENGEADGANVANLDEVPVTEASRSVIHVHWGWEDHVVPRCLVWEKQPQ